MNRNRPVGERCNSRAALLMRMVSPGCQLSFISLISATYLRSGLTPNAFGNVPPASFDYACAQFPVLPVRLGNPKSTLSELRAWIILSRPHWLGPTSVFFPIYHPNNANLRWDGIRRPTDKWNVGVQKLRWWEELDRGADINFTWERKVHVDCQLRIVCDYNVKPWLK